MAYTQATGRRKTSHAKVFFKQATAKKGDITINKKTLLAYFPHALDQACVLMPLRILSQEGAYDIRVDVQGGGSTGQAEAVRHGIARALVLNNPAYRAPLKAEGFLTRDPRRKERYTPGRPGRRRRSPFRKR